MKPPTRRFVSSKTGTWITPAEATDPNYWTRHIRETVRFSDAIDTLAAEGPLAWIEAGPGRAVSAFAKANPRAETQAVERQLTRILLQAAPGRGRLVIQAPPRY